MDHNENRSKVPFIRILLASVKKRLLPIFLLFLALAVIYVAVVGIPRLTLTVDIDRAALSFVAGRALPSFFGFDFREVPYAANREELDPLLDAISGRYAYAETVNLKNRLGGAPSLIVLGDGENNPSESFRFERDRLWVKGGASYWHCYIREEGTPSVSPLLDYLYENGTPVNLTLP